MAWTTHQSTWFLYTSPPRLPFSLPSLASSSLNSGGTLGGSIEGRSWGPMDQDADRSLVQCSVVEARAKGCHKEMSKEMDPI